MKLTVQVVMEHADGSTVVTEVTSLERDPLSTETLGLTLAESKALLAGVQEVLVAQQGPATARHTRPVLDAGHHARAKGGTRSWSGHSLGRCTWRVSGW